MLSQDLLFAPFVCVFDNIYLPFLYIEKKKFVKNILYIKNVL